MNKEIFTSTLTGNISAISSKSYAHRLLICAMLSQGEVVIEGIDRSKDIEATVNVAKALGADIGHDGKNYIVGELNPKACAAPDCMESGSTLRFFLPIACALGIDTRFTGSERLLSRPNAGLIKCLEDHGVRADGYHLAGKLTAGNYFIDASVSSQYVSGLLMALPLIGGECSITLDGEVVSSSYIDITLEALETAGIKVIRNGAKQFVVPGGQKYCLPHNVSVPKDWSNAAFFLVAGAFSEGGITVGGLNINDRQGDKAILSILRSAGVDVFVGGSVVTVKRAQLKPFEADIDGTPDLAPIASALAAAAKGDSVLYGVDRLRYKESDRLSAIMEMLDCAGISGEYKSDSLVIHGVGRAKPAEYDGYNDHRMVMSEAILCLLADGASIIRGAEAVDKSYPKFFEHYNLLGGKARDLA